MKLLYKILNVNLEYVWFVVFGLYAGLVGAQIVVFLVSGEMEKVNGLLFQFFLSVFMALCPTVISPYLRDFKKFKALRKFRKGELSWNELKYFLDD